MNRTRVLWTQMAKLTDEFLPKPQILHPWPSGKGGHDFAVANPRNELALTRLVDYVTPYSGRKIETSGAMYRCLPKIGLKNALRTLPLGLTIETRITPLATPKKYAWL